MESTALGDLNFLLGEEVALYCAKYLPDIIKDQKAYKEGKLQKVCFHCVGFALLQTEALPSFLYLTVTYLLYFLNNSLPKMSLFTLGSFLDLPNSLLPGL